MSDDLKDEDGEGIANVQVDVKPIRRDMTQEGDLPELKRNLDELTKSGLIAKYTI